LILGVDSSFKDKTNEIEEGEEKSGVNDDKE